MTLGNPFCGEPGQLHWLLLVLELLVCIDNNMWFSIATGVYENSSVQLVVY